jgi:hypothetical protein
MVNFRQPSLCNLQWENQKLIFLLEPCNSPKGFHFILGSIVCFMYSQFNKKNSHFNEYKVIWALCDHSFPWTLIHFKLHSINLINVTPSLISQNFREQMFLGLTLTPCYHASLHLSWILTLKQPTEYSHALFCHVCNYC